MSLVRYERDGAVGRLTLDRPGMHNALVPQLLEDLLAALARAASDGGCRALLLRAEGPAFSIGGDMRRFARERDGDLVAYSRRLVGLLNEAILALLAQPQPVVAAVHGVLTGGSLGLVLAADLVYLSPAATIKAHYASAGFAPDGGWTALLPELIGRRRAAVCLLLNRSLRPEEAVQWGLANAVVAADKLNDEALAAAHRIAGHPRGTMDAVRELLRPPRERVAAALEAERERFLALIAGAEATAGVEAFLRNFSDYPDGEPSC